MSLLDLPEEILDQIISHLDTLPRSVTHVRHEPRHRLFDSSAQPLKSLSATCKKLRRLTLPLLFHYAKFNGAHWTDDSLLRVKASDGRQTEHEYSDLGIVCSTCTIHVVKLTPLLEAFLTFLETTGLQKCVTSLVLERRIEDYTQPEGCDYHGAQDQEHNNSITQWDDTFSSGRLWSRIFSVIDCPRLILLGPAIEVARLAGCLQVTTHFNDATNHYQLLELDRNTPIHAGSGGVRDTDFGLATKAAGPYKLAPDGLLHLRRWQHIGLNEGSFSRSIGEDGTQTFNRSHQKPSLLRYLLPACCGQTDTNHDHRFLHTVNAMSFLDSFAYTAIFPPSPQNVPFSSSSQTRGIPPLKYVRKLDIQLTPVMGDEWDHPSTPDLIHGAMSTLYNIRHNLFASFHQSDWRLREVVCRDSEHELIGQSLARIFAGHTSSRHLPLATETEHWGKMGKTWRIIDLEDGSKGFIVSEWCGLDGFVLGDHGEPDEG